MSLKEGGFGEVPSYIRREGEPKDEVNEMDRMVLGSFKEKQFETGEVLRHYTSQPLQGITGVLGLLSASVDKLERVRGILHPACLIGGGVLSKLSGNVLERATQLNELLTEYNQKLPEIKTMNLTDFVQTMEDYKRRIESLRVLKTS